MSLALGLDPAGLLELDGPMVDALERAAPSRWSYTDELLAKLVELVQLQRIEFLQAHGAKRLPRFVPVERPGEARRVLSPLEFAAEFGPKGADA
jgi:hypothetical protein